MRDISHAGMQASLQATFDAALATPTYRSEGDRWPYHVDQDLQQIFGSDGSLDVATLVPRWAHLMRGKFPRSKWSSPGVKRWHWEGLGNLFHWGLAFELVTRDPDDGSLWRLVRNERSFVIDTKHGWTTVRIRGLPPQEQAAQYKREAALKKLHATLDGKARDKADARIRRSLDYTLQRDPDALVDMTVMNRRLPEICHGRPLAAVRQVIEETHHRLGMNRADLALWITDLENYGMIQPERRIMAQYRQAPVEPPPPPVPPVPIEIPAEDAAALAGLAF